MVILFFIPCYSICEMLINEFMYMLVLMTIKNLFFGWELPSLISIFLFYDKLSISLVLMTMWLSTMMMMTFGNYHKEEKMKKTILTLFIVLIMLNMFLSINSMFFFMMFELSMIPTMFMILGSGYQPERLEAFFNFFYFTSIPSMPFLIYILSKKNMLMINLIFSSFSLNMMFYVMTLVFFAKIPMYMFHYWLPKAHVEAPIEGSMILAGILLKMGGYGLLRFMSLHSFFMEKWFMMSISIWGMIISCIMCIFSPDLKSIIAYSSVSHMNFMITGLLMDKNLVFFSSIMIMLSHALTSSGMFFLCDVMYKRTSSRSLIMNKSMILHSPLISGWWAMLCIMNMAFPLSPSNLSELYVGMTLVKMFSFLINFFLFSYFFISSFYSMFIFFSVNYGLSGKEILFCPMNLKENLNSFCHLIPCMFLTLISYMMIL